MTTATDDRAKQASAYATLRSTYLAAHQEAVYKGIRARASQVIASPALAEVWLMSIYGAGPHPQGIQEPYAKYYTIPADWSSSKHPSPLVPNVAALGQVKQSNFARQMSDYMHRWCALVQKADAAIGIPWKKETRTLPIYVGGVMTTKRVTDYPAHLDLTAASANATTVVFGPQGFAEVEATKFLSNTDAQTPAWSEDARDLVQRVINRVPKTAVRTRSNVSAEVIALAGNAIKRAQSATNIAATPAPDVNPPGGGGGGSGGGGGGGGNNSTTGTLLIALALGVAAVLLLTSG